MTIGQSSSQQQQQVYFYQRNAPLIPSAPYEPYGAAAAPYQQPAVGYAQPQQPQQGLFSDSVSVVNPYESLTNPAGNPDWPFKRKRASGALYFSEGIWPSLNLGTFIFLLACIAMIVVVLGVGIGTGVYLVFTGLVVSAGFFLLALSMQYQAQANPRITVTLDDNLRQVKIYRFGAIFLFLYWLLRGPTRVPFEDIVDVVVEQTPTLRFKKRYTGILYLVTRTQGNIAISGPLIFRTAEIVALGVKRMLAAKVPSMAPIV